MTEASRAARDESERWMFTRTLVDLLEAGWIGPEPTERAVTGYDAHADLERRARFWSHTLVSLSLSNVLSFGAALAAAEADAWDSDDPSIATRALSDRRLLLGDRIIHWAVPWLVTVGSTEGDWAPEAMAAATAILDLGDLHRVAPALTGREGLVPPGHDSLGPVPDTLIVADVRGGWLFQDHISQVGSEPYDAAAALWQQVAASHPGSAQLWLDLADRATASAERLRLAGPT